MNIKQREKIVNQLLTCQFKYELDGVTYLVKDADAALRSEAQTLYDNIVYQCRFENWISDSKTGLLLITKGLWAFEGDKQLEELEKKIDDLKVELFNAGFLKGNLSADIRKQLKMAKAKYAKKQQLRHSLDYVTVNGYAEFVKQQFLIASCLYYAETNKLVFDNLDKADQFLLDYTIAQIYNRKPTSEELREVARTDPWRTYWNISRENPFSVSLVDLTDEQRTVLLYSRMYDSCYEHPECPSEEVMEDDDMLDGWLISNRRKREKDKQTSAIEEHVGKMHGNAQEVFVVTDNAKGREKIESLNSMEALIAKKRKAKMLKAQGTVDDKDMPDQVDKKAMEITRQTSDRFKGLKNG